MVNSAAFSFVTAVVGSTFVSLADFSSEEEVYQITTAPNDFTAVAEELTKNNLTFLEAGVQMVPSTYVSLDEKASEKMQRLIDNLDDLDDVLEVFHNWEE